jgi:2-oxoglutarate ferredoxin oxidoreductase subunit alpha
LATLRTGGKANRYLVDVIGYNKVRGLPFKAEELSTAIKDVINRD